MSIWRIGSLCLLQSTRVAIAWWGLAWPATNVVAAATESTRRIDFGRDVRPLLAANCYPCHGPDAEHRAAGLRLDLREGALQKLESGHRAVVPGAPQESELLRRIVAEDPLERMPPAETNKVLSADQSALLRQWIVEGAVWQDHWAFVPPQRPNLPEVANPSWAQHPIDRFVLARLEQEDLLPGAPADRATLIRRLSLDLTGLPPSVAEVDAFLADARDTAYELLVDRLLQSEHYGEKMAQWWLDLARFGDTNGYQDDGYRPIWVYRDYVIDSFNRNKPFDQFTIESLAGDMLPGASVEQQVLSGFHRMHRYNEEGGSDPDEFRVVYAIDRTNTTATTWLGLTLGCAQCHDHKYDPLSQREYYGLYAFFNSLAGEIAVSKDRPSAPFIHAPSLDQQARLAAMDATAKADPTKAEAIQRERDELAKEFFPALVMAEMAPRRPAHLLRRGDWQQPGDVVDPDVPAIFPYLPPEAPRNRLTLARWLTRSDHPLTARVLVNHLWRQFFGAGLVRTMYDFGTQGEPPSHPELLDWLAVECIENGWNVKQLQKSMVMSATYRQSSAATPAAIERDPENRLLARGSRFRLSAEEVRDAALAASGRLSRRIGGPSVSPYQPDGFYGDKAGDWTWTLSEGDDLYRRGLYTFWRRTTLYPAFALFDAPDRGLCTADRPRTNTPLQALVTLNDPAYVEAARLLGQRVLSSGVETLDERLQLAFRCVVSRSPNAAERSALRAIYDDRLERYRNDVGAAEQLVSVGRAARIATQEPAELAAWTTVASVLLNLDEAVTRE